MNLLDKYMHYREMFIETIITGCCSTYKDNQMQLQSETAAVVVVGAQFILIIIRLQSRC